MPARPTPTGLQLLAVLFVLRFAWDVFLLSQAWSTPKFGIAVVLLPLAYGLWHNKELAVHGAGVVCLFWIGFAVAVPLARMIPGAPQLAYPWANLLAIPGLLYLLQHSHDRSTSDKAVS